MDRKQKESIEAYGRVKAFLADHPLPSPTSYGTPQRLLEDAVARLHAHATTQHEGARAALAGTRRLHALCRELRANHLRPIAAVTKAAMLGAPGLEAGLRVPATAISGTRLVAEAQAIRNAVAPHEAAFIENGRPADFLARMDAVITELHAFVAARSGGRGDRIAARRAITEEIRRGRNAVELLDAIVRTHFAGNEFVLARWNAARRLVAVPTSATQGVTEPSEVAA
jgi:hypothetical protein